jgi:GDPmannose 4,6-dehydratase
MKTALITGITGQDGAYLTELLLRKGYRVFGTYRRTSSANFWRLDFLGVRQHPELRLVEHDMTDLGSCLRIIEAARPDEIYNLAAQTFVGVSFAQPSTTAAITGLGALNLLEAIRTLDRRIRYYQASSAEMFGKVQAVPQSETTPFYPRSPYGTAKVFAHWTAINYRESYGIFAASGILFNHESPLRGPEFVTRKIAEAAARCAAGEETPLALGNLDARRDWGYAAEYVEGMWRMLQAEEPDTFVLATNRTETVRSFATLAYRTIGVDLEWRGSGAEECGIDAADGRELVRVDTRLRRPAEVDLLQGDNTRAGRVLGWTPRTTLEELAAMMVTADVRRLEETATIRPLQPRGRRAPLVSQAVA